jgi:hypothetical protein
MGFFSLPLQDLICSGSVGSSAAMWIWWWQALAPLGGSSGAWTDY